MTPKALLGSSAFMMSMALIIALLTNFAGVFPSETLDADLRSNLTVFLLAVMMTLSLSRYRFSNLNPVTHWKSVLRAVLMGLVVSSVIPLLGYFLLKDSEFGAEAAGLVLRLYTAGRRIGNLFFAIQDIDSLENNLFREKGHLLRRLLKAALEPVLHQAHTAGDNEGKVRLKDQRVPGAEDLHPVPQAFFADQMLEAVDEIQIPVLSHKDFHKVRVFIDQGKDFMED